MSVLVKGSAEAVSAADLQVADVSWQTAGSYGPADVTDLPECLPPLFDLVGLEVDHNSFEVTIGGATTLDVRTEIDGVTIPRAYVSEVPMAQRYFLF
ncbi:hypothetical protein [Streptomyces mirabilis]|uniref:hypothetical protein n=1 Tax=Streptomyces mirabilis TaxID=68239 RepID=UPI0033A79132